jgi:S-adenosylmethionine-dependent methyltransferase
VPESEKTFDSATDAWRQWQESPWGRLRYAVAEANLARHLGALSAAGGPLRILDLAGGDGADAVRLALRGHHVTVADHAPAMLDLARGRADAAGVADRIACVRADVGELPAEVADGGFDAVLCHNLIQYADDPAAVLRTTVRAARPGGLVSVMAVNRHSAAVAAVVRACDPAAALAALDASEEHSATFGTRLTLYAAEDVVPILTALGCTDVRHYGIRVFNDLIADDERKHDPDFYAELERLELAATERQPYVNIARLFQLVALTSPA